MTNPATVSRVYCLSANEGFARQVIRIYGEAPLMEFVSIRKPSDLEQVLAETIPPVVLVDVSDEGTNEESVGCLERLASQAGYALTMFSVGENSYTTASAGWIDLLSVGHLREDDLARGLKQWWGASSANLPVRRIPVRFEAAGEQTQISTYESSFGPVLEKLKRIAPHDVTLLLVGETGTGKTTLAQLIHELSPRATGPFQNVACGALPRDLIESELFGHVRGAFTGADRAKTGRFEAAGRGTLLLDEIDILGQSEQAKLLKVMETGEYETVGSSDVRHSEARLIVASNVDLQMLVRTNRFRSDLYYRLNVLEFPLPSLRDRPHDLVPLAMQFVKECASQHGIEIRRIERGFLEGLRQHHWPGNLRELKNHIRRAVLFCEGGVLTRRDLPTMQNLLATETAAESPFASPAMSHRFNGNASFTLAESPQWNDEFADVAPTSEHRFDPHHVGFVSNLPLDADPAEPRTLADRVASSEREILEAALKSNGNHRLATAKALGISRVGLYKKMRRLGMLTPRGSASEKE